MPKMKIKRALIAVYDKTGIADFARSLVEEFGIEIISTGGTARHLRDAGIPVTLVEEVTGFPEMLDGRVKTLHPKIHAAILADRDNPEHMRQLAEQGIKPIDMVVVNLYPFEETVQKPGCTFDEAIEMIDIGGPCLLRAAAKNHRHVVVITDRSDGRSCLRDMRAPTMIDPDSLRDWRRERAFYAMWLTARYDAQVSQWLGRHMGYYSMRTLTLRLETDLPSLRYGENPHQTADVFEHEDPRPVDEVIKQNSFPITDLSIILEPDGQGPLSERAALPLSFNNFVDADAALELCAELTRAENSLWHRLLAGESGKTTHSPTVSSRQPVREEQHTRRNLPHIQRPGATYFVTFRLRGGVLSPAERDIVLACCVFPDAKKICLHAAVVMPDHVHVLFTPLAVSSDSCYSLGEILQGIKGVSARRINEARGGQGSLWLDESWDRVMRHEKEYQETLEYIQMNPITAGLAEEGKYRWFVCEEEIGWDVSVSAAGVDLEHKLILGMGEAAQQAQNHRLIAGATRTAGATGIDGATKDRQHGAGGCCIFVKHTNACGVGIVAAHEDSIEAVAQARVEAYRRAYLGDPHAAMGGILAVNFEVDASFSEEVMGSLQRWGKEAGAGAFFIEVWIAPSFQEKAVEVIREAKKWGQRVRLLSVGDVSKSPDENEFDFKRIAGGMLVQSRDLLGLNENQWKVVTERTPTDRELADLRLAWLVCKHTKSNAISICRDGMLIGNGAGQMSRVMSCRIATWLAKENGHEEKLAGAVAASDAFFPFRDGPDILADAGVRAIIQPGGSKRDAETIAACNEHGLAMICTGTRHFKH